MNKYLLILIPVILLGLVLYFVAKPSKTSRTEPQRMLSNNNDEDTAADDTTTPEPAPLAFKKVPPVDSYIYRITTGTANYKAQKEFFSKPTLEVVGVTSDVSGGGWYDVSGKALYVESTVDLQTLATDSAKRDEDVMKLFTNTTATLVMDVAENTMILLGQEFTNIKLPVTLTINGVSKEVEFTISGNVTDADFSARGTSTVTMAEFGITAPSLVEVFTVNPELVLEFDVVGVRAN